jgi:hypothetical protein
VLIKVVEGGSHIKVTKPEPKSKAAKVEDAGSDSDEDESEEDEEDLREKVWKTGKELAEIAIRGVKAGGLVEIMVNVAGDLSVTLTAREVKGQGGVRGQLVASQ